MRYRNDERKPRTKVLMTLGGGAAFRAELAALARTKAVQDAKAERAAAVRAAYQQETGKTEDQLEAERQRIAAWKANNLR